MICKDSGSTKESIVEKEKKEEKGATKSMVEVVKIAVLKKKGLLNKMTAATTKGGKAKSKGKAKGKDNAHKVKAKGKAKGEGKGKGKGKAKGKATTEGGEAKSKGKAKGKGKGKGKAQHKVKVKGKGKGKAKGKGRKPKPAKWLKERPNGCPKCRNSPGCTPSCWRDKTKPTL